MLNPDIQKLISTALTDDNHRKRSSAREQLINIGESVVEPLIAALKVNDASMKRRAVYMLKKIGDRRALEPLITALKDDNENVRQEVLSALATMPDTRSLEPIIDLLYRNEEINLFLIQNKLASALSAIGTPAVDRLIALLDNAYNSFDIRMIAAKALGDIADPRAVEPLISALLVDNRFVRASAAEALGQMADPRAIVPLINAIERAYDDYQHTEDNLSEAHFSLELIGPPAVEPLIEVLKFGNKYMRAMAAGVLGEIGDQRAIEPLVIALEDADEYVRYNAAFALGEIRNTRAIEPLTVLMRDANSDVGKAARSALDKISESNP